MINHPNDLQLDIDDDIEFNVVNRFQIKRLDEQYERLTQVISKFASALTARDITVSLVDPTVNTNTPDTQAWSEADSITFNQGKIGDLDDADTALAIKGVSLHEIAHILLTPRSGSNLVKWVKNNNYIRAFNALEDQRIETFLSAKYSNVKYWFTGAVMKYLLSNPQAYSVIYPLIVGRAYLPQNLRDALAKMYDKQSDVREIADIVSQYTVLNLSDSAHIPLAQSLIARFHKLIDDGFKDPTKDSWKSQHSGWDELPSMHDSGDGSGSLIKSSEKSKPMNKAGQDKIIEKILKQRQQQPATPSGSDEGEEYESDAGKDGNSKSSGKSDGDGDDADGDNSDSRGKPGTGIPDDGGKPNPGGSGGAPSPTDTIQEIAKQQLTNVKNVLSNDITNLISQFNGEAELTSKVQPTPQRPSRGMTQQPVAPSVVQQVKSFVHQLELIRAEHDPGWLTRVNTGKLNVQRYAKGVDPDEAFDLWDDGREDVVDIETVVLLDNSGSMSWTMEQAADSAWAIKRSMDKIGAATTVVTFSDDARLLYSSKEKAKVTKAYSGVDGGTDPMQALEYAKYVFASSERAIKILIVITDGQWFNGSAPDKIITQLNKGGVITALGHIDEVNRLPKDLRGNYYGSEPMKIEGHNAQIVVPMSDGGGLLTLAKALVKLGIKRNLGK